MKKIAFVTGSSRGIGRAIAFQLAKDGFDVIIHYKSNELKAIEVANSIKKEGRESWVIRGDLDSLDDIKTLREEIYKITDKIDLLVNNAAISQYLNLEETGDEEIRDVININLTSRIILTKYLLPLLKKSNSAQIINIASRLGKEKTIQGASIYSAAEAGVIKFTQCCALEFAPYKIRVNTVSPGFTNTDMNKDIIEEVGGADVIGKNIPVGRIAEPEDIANVVSFIASEKSSYINGENIGVNGGSVLV
jgi:3-oxoacyl-[acyl-carrier protein] reductase